MGQVGNLIIAIPIGILFIDDFCSYSTTCATNLPVDSSPQAYHPLPVPVFQTRYDIGTILESEGLNSGVELGVQLGHYAAEILKRWPRCREYVLVDLWAKQENYFDGANVDNSIQNEILNTAMQSTSPWKDKIRVCRNYTTACAINYPDNHFDWVYVDARHDRQGVTEDLTTWWPKLRNGGLMCGHDFVTQFEGPQQQNDRWDINGDGSVDPTGGAVRGSVEDWARLQHRQIQIGYKESEWWTWCIRK